MLENGHKSLTTLTPLINEWTFADVWETIADSVPDRAALVHDGKHVSWRDLDRRAEGVGAVLLAADLRLQDKVALYLHNSPAYMESAFAVLKSRLVPVNTNYRYTGDELVQLWADADAAAVIFHGVFTKQVDAVRAQCPAVKVWLFVNDGHSICPSWAIPFETGAQTGGDRGGAVSQGRSGDDQVLIYTGGTTGLPRGVIWRQHDLFMASNTTRDPITADLAHVRKRLSDSVPPIGLPAAPLMHGTGFMFAATILNRGGTVVTLPGPSFDVEVLLDTVVRERVTDLCIVGDAFCRPIVDALDREPNRWSLAQLNVVSSSGMVWSADVKARFLEHAPSALLIDFLSASEASGMGRALASKRQQGDGSRFKLGDNACVIGQDGTLLKPGEKKPGRLAVRGFIPLGYYKDPEKTAATFPVIDGVRYSVPGDLAKINDDGSIILLGRGSTSINTGGEKVYPEEVEEAIVSWPDAADALVVGIPHERFGQMVVAAVAVNAGAALNEESLLEHLRGQLAAHKIPRAIMPVDTIGRGPNGKADRRAVTAKILAWQEIRLKKDIK
jgi:acyl-CoA synthetase (AMP-forming)/AMP-acid ligase II